MTDKNSYTRRAALGLMGAGAAFAVSETSGFTQITADRSANVNVASDKNAYLGIEEGGTSQSLSTEKTYITTSLANGDAKVKLTNRFGESVDVSASDVDGGKFNFSEFTGSSLPDDSSRTGSVSLASSKRFAEGPIQFSADSPDGSGVHLDANRTMLVGYIPNTPLKAWFDANQTSTVTTSDGTFSEWGSQPSPRSDASFDLTPPSSYGPTSESSNVKTGRTVVNFAKTQYLSGTSIDLTTGDSRGATIFMLLDPSDPGQALNFYQNSSNYIWYWNRNSTSSNALQFKLTSQGNAQGAKLSTPSNPHIVTLRFKNDGKKYVTGEVRYRTASNTPSFSSDTTGKKTTMLSSATPYVGANQSGSNGYTGDIGEIMIYDTPLSDNLVDYVEQYLVQKWLP